ncbi:hypothetical protein CEXT_376701 [Caerostris extrusa]|uniref:Uncharacterized protein n=1 Tax=Caerostris extrusa TaxID=172846 RepID=A0AAV4NST1_CAEEX|nr:hypothetical protein CEXT_376701 [Caerostris extrusa]
MFIYVHHKTPIKMLESATYEHQQRISTRTGINFLHGGLYLQPLKFLYLSSRSNAPGRFPSSLVSATSLISFRCGEENPPASIAAAVVDT